MRDRRFAVTACLGLGLTLFGCDRGQQESAVNPLPKTGFSETVAVGDRGTQARGALDSRAQAPNATKPAAATGAAPLQQQPAAPSSPH